jgi:hypothetical protein
MRVALFFIALFPGVIVWVLGGLVFFGMALEKNFSSTVAFLWVPIWIVISAVGLPKIISSAIEGDFRDVEEKTRKDRAKAREQREAIYAASFVRRELEFEESLVWQREAIREMLGPTVTIKPKTPEEIAEDDRRYEEWKRNYPHQ